LTSKGNKIVTEEFNEEPNFTDIDHTKPPKTNPQRMRRRGRPSKYSDLYAQKLYEFFDLDSYVEARGEHVTNSGKVIYDLKKGVRFPTVEGFCVWAGISKETVYAWAKETLEDKTKKYQYFSDALAHAQEVQANLLVNGGISGEYNLGLTKIILSAHHDYVEKSKQEVDLNVPIQVTFLDQDKDA
jgi:hypothetical protein